MPASLAAIHIYPVKSASGIALARCAVDDFGFRYDRRWMVTDESGVFVSQRDEPRLALLATALTADALVLAAPGMQPLTVPLEPARSDREPVEVWNDRVDAERCGAAADEWMARFLGKPARLVRMPDDARRQVDRRFAEPGERTSFSDGFPFLLIGQASLDDLNGRLAQPLPMNRFRPNLVVNGSHAFAEDQWARITFDDLTLRVVKPCARCVVTTTDQETAERGHEPLRTLATYRTRDGKVMFGQNLIHEATGTLEVGMPMRVIEARSGH
jgi:uncharacterized protein